MLHEQQLTSSCHFLLECLTFSLSANKEEKEERDQVNQQCERYWLKHYHFLYWVSLTNLEAIYMIMCECSSAAVSCSFFFSFELWCYLKHGCPYFQVLFETINRKKKILSLSHFSYDKIIWIMINLHWNQLTMMSII